MAHLDTLIERITDPKLRSEIQDQVSKLAAKTSFGLVFEEHRPESVVLPGFAISRGGKVSFHDRTKPGIWVVIKIANDRATLVAQDDRSVRIEAAVEDLVVVREFGDPIYPGLESVGTVIRGADKPFHSVINAENFHAVETLLYPYEGKVDVIYLDPPYNSGAKDWKYNNDYVDGNDQYRHSKWLSFIDKRLRIAKRLLNPKNSVLIFTIDEKEYLRAGLLLEQIFSGATIQMVSIFMNPRGTPRNNTFSRSDEYAFFVFIGDAQASPVSLGPEWQTDEKKTVRGKLHWSGLRKTSDASARSDRPNGFFPIFVENDGSRIVSVGEGLSLDTPRDTVEAPEGTTAAWPIRKDGSEGRWRLSPTSVRKAMAGGFIRVGGRTSGGYAIYYLTSGEQAKVKSGEYLTIGHRPDGSVITDDEQSGAAKFIPSTQWKIKAHDAGVNGSNLISGMLNGRKFPFPKSLYAVEDTLRFFVADKRDALIVDFFGGSGTTAHAVMRLNRQDDGRRRSIVVTNNAVSEDEDAQLRLQGHQPGDLAYEALGIFEYITKPRIEAAVTGLKPDGAPLADNYKFVDEFPMSEGFEENVEFFKLTYEDNQLVRLGHKFQAIAPILWMRAGAEGERIDDLPDDGWAVPAAGFYGLLTDIDQWEPFVDAVNVRSNIRCVYIVTDSQAEFEAINVQIDQRIDSVRLYSDYLQTFEINTRQG